MILLGLDTFILLRSVPPTMINRRWWQKLKQLQQCLRRIVWMKRFVKLQLLDTHQR